MRIRLARATLATAAVAALALASLPLAPAALAAPAADSATPYTNCATPSYPLLFGYGYAVVCLLDDGPVYPGDPPYPGYDAHYNNVLYAHMVNSGLVAYGVQFAQVGQSDYTYGDGATSGRGNTTNVEADAYDYSLAAGEGSGNALAQHEDERTTCDAGGACSTTTSRSTTLDSVTFVSERGPLSEGVGVHYAQADAGQGCTEEAHADVEQDGAVQSTQLLGPQPCTAEAPQLHDAAPFPDWPDLPAL